MASMFDGVRAPTLQLTAAFGEPLDPGADYLHLGVGPGLGTGMLGGAVEVDISADLRAVSLSQRGRSTDYDSADPVTATITLNNRHGNYDPSNPASPYWGAQLLSAQQQSLEDGTTSGWAVGGNCTISSTAAQAHSGSRSLALTSTAGSGGIWANTTTGTGGLRVAPGDPIQVSAWFRSATRSVSGIVAVLFWDTAGSFISQANAAGVATTTSSWVQGSTITVAPTGAAYASAQVLYDSVIAVGEVHYADDVVVQSSGITDGVPIRLRAIWDGVAYNRFYGGLVDAQLGMDTSGDATATFTAIDGLEALARAYLPVSAPQFEGDLTGERVGRLADDAVWPSSLRLVDTGYTTLGRTTLGGSALELMRQVAATEYGLLFVDGSGRLVFYDRHHGALETRSTSVQATFGPGGIGAQSFTFERNRDSTFNRVAITRDPAPNDPSDETDPPEDEPVEQVADDSASIGAKGILAFGADVGSLSRNDSDALALAEYLVQRYATTQNRITQISVNALRGGWASTLSLGPLDRVSVVHDYGPNTISVELHIQGITESISVSPPAWDMTFSTSNLPPVPSFWLLGDATDGKLGTAGLAW